MSEGIIWKSFEEWRSDAQARWMAGGLNYTIADAWNARNAEVAALTTAKERAEAACAIKDKALSWLLSSIPHFEGDDNLTEPVEDACKALAHNPGAAILDRLAILEAENDRLTNLTQGVH